MLNAVDELTGLPRDAHATRTSVHGVKGCQAQLWCEEDERGFVGRRVKSGKIEGLVGGGWGCSLTRPPQKMKG
jgi:hypothetical protein